MLTKKNFIVATLLERDNTGKFVTIGYKLCGFTYDSTGVQSPNLLHTELLSTATLLNSKKDIENAMITPQGLVGTMGSLDRYCKLDVESGNYLDVPPMVILGKDNEGYYLTVDNPQDEEIRVSRKSYSMLQHDILTRRESSLGVKVANAKVRIKNKGCTVYPIAGQFSVFPCAPLFIESNFKFKGVRPPHKDSWLVRIVRNGEKYGRDYCLVNQGEPMVEFYDTTQDKDVFPIGQYVSSYKLSTLLQRGDKALCLNGEIEAWTISYENMTKICNWLRGIRL